MFSQCSRCDVIMTARFLGVPYIFYMHCMYTFFMHLHVSIFIYFDGVYLLGRSPGGQPSLRRQHSASPTHDRILIASKSPRKVTFIAFDVCAPNQVFEFVLCVEGGMYTGPSGWHPSPPCSPSPLLYDGSINITNSLEQRFLIYFIAGYSTYYVLTSEVVYPFLSPVVP